MKILYMNQGGNGNWGGIKYLEYDLLLLAESTDQTKEGFNEEYKSKENPPMSIQVNGGKQTRIISQPKDLDVLSKEVRPLLWFQLVGIKAYVVFVHLKSGNEEFATGALKTAAKNLLGNFGQGSATPVLWIGDFNRAEEVEALTEGFGKPTVLLKGGGQSKWDLDRAMITGKWNNHLVPQEISSSGDNGHIGIEVEITNV